MNELSRAATVRIVHQRAHFCCEYCQTCQQIMGQAMHIEHIEPNGDNSLDNLCLSCPSCNLSKAKATSAPDPSSGEIVRLFNPRTQIWQEHFEWIEDGIMLRGLTEVGRATIERLKINLPRIVDARRVWVEAGKHPPNLIQQS
jgi:hypothetical protein